jgi:hypothetical protein
MSDIIREILEDYYIYEKGGNALWNLMMN